jgi:hypothetical protein
MTTSLAGAACGCVALLRAVMGAYKGHLTDFLSAAMPSRTGSGLTGTVRHVRGGFRAGTGMRGRRPGPSGSLARATSSLQILLAGRPAER